MRKTWSSGESEASSSDDDGEEAGQASPRRGRGDPHRHREEEEAKGEDDEVAVDNFDEVVEMMRFTPTMDWPHRFYTYDTMVGPYCMAAEGPTAVSHETSPAAQLRCTLLQQAVDCSTAIADTTAQLDVLRTEVDQNAALLQEVTDLIQQLLAAESSLESQMTTLEECKDELYNAFWTAKKADESDSAIENERVRWSLHQRLVCANKLEAAWVQCTIKARVRSQRELRSSIAVAEAGICDLLLQLTRQQREWMRLSKLLQPFSTNIPLDGTEDDGVDRTSMAMDYVHNSKRLATAVLAQANTACMEAVEKSARAVTTVQVQVGNSAAPSAAMVPTMATDAARRVEDTFQTNNNEDADRRRPTKRQRRSHSQIHDTIARGRSRRASTQAATLASKQFVPGRRYKKRKKRNAPPPAAT